MSILDDILGYSSSSTPNIDPNTFTYDPTPTDAFFASTPDNTSLFDGWSTDGIVSGVTSVGKTITDLVNAVGTVSVNNETNGANLKLQQNAISTATLNSDTNLQLAKIQAKAKLAEAQAAAMNSSVPSVLKNVSNSDQTMIFLGLAGVVLAFMQYSKG